MSATPAPPGLGEPLPQRVVVVRALHLGDLLCAVPAFRALRAALPQAELTLVGLPWARAFVERFRGYLDAFMPFPGFPGIPEGPQRLDRLPGFLQEARRRRFDLALQLHGNGTVSNTFTLLLGARITAGFYVPGQPCPDPRWFLPYPDDLPEVCRPLRLLEGLGVPAGSPELEFPLTAEDEAALAALEEARALRPGEYACVHPGARAPARRWTPEGFAAVGDWLASQALTVVLTGTAAERPLVQAVASAMRHPACVLAGRTSLGALAVLLRGARLLVCNDTGVSHLAAALGTPSVVVFTGSDPRRWAPLDRRRHRIVRQAVECSPCPYFDCPIDHRCARRLSPDAVIAQAEGLLRDGQQAA